jgi:hypothetical protein
MQSPQRTGSPGRIIVTLRDGRVVCYGDTAR